MLNIMIQFLAATLTELRGVAQLLADGTEGFSWGADLTVTFGTTAVLGIVALIDPTGILATSATAVGIGMIVGAIITFLLIWLGLK